MFIVFFRYECRLTFDFLAKFNWAKNNIPAEDISLTTNDENLPNVKALHIILRIATGGGRKIKFDGDTAKDARIVYNNAVINNFVPEEQDQQNPGKSRQKGWGYRRKLKNVFQSVSKKLNPLKNNVQSEDEQSIQLS